MRIPYEDAAGSSMSRDEPRETKEVDSAALCWCAFGTTIVRLCTALIAIEEHTACHLNHNSDSKPPFSAQLRPCFNVCMAVCMRD